MAVNERPQQKAPVLVLQAQSMRSIVEKIENARKELEFPRISFVVSTSNSKPRAVVKTEEADSEKTHDETSLYSSAVAKARISYDYARNNPGHVAATVGAVVLGTVGTYKACQHAPSMVTISNFTSNMKDSASAYSKHAWNTATENASRIKTAVESNPYVQSASAKAAQAREYAMNSRPAVMFSQMGTQLKDKVHSGLVSVMEKTATARAAAQNLLVRKNLKIGG